MPDKTNGLVEIRAKHGAVAYWVAVTCILPPFIALAVTGVALGFVAMIPGFALLCIAALINWACK